MSTFSLVQCVGDEVDFAYEFREDSIWLFSISFCIRLTIWTDMSP